jgi:hypothetical protein
LAASTRSLNKRQWLLLAGRSIVLGWVTLLLMVYLCEHPLLILVAGKMGANWFPTIRLILDCLVLAVTGWVVGRLGPTNTLFAVTVFAATLTLRDFTDLVEIDVPWLLRLAIDTLRDARYRDGLFYTAVVQTFLFGSLIVGALLSRRAPATAISIVAGSR